MGGTVWKGTDGAAVSYRCSKSIYGQGVLSAELGITIDAQVEAPGHGKWWLDGKTGSDKRYCQQCMCAINTPGEETNNNKPMSSAKWIESDGDIVAVSPAEECVRMLNNPFRVNGIKSEGMRAKRKGKALVECNGYNMVPTPWMMCPSSLTGRYLFQRVSTMGYGHTTIYALTPTWALAGRLFAGWHVGADHVRSS